MDTPKLLESTTCSATTPIKHHLLQLNFSPPITPLMIRKTPLPLVLPKVVCNTCHIAMVEPQLLPLLPLQLLPSQSLWFENEF
tara:strand:- start:187 stop:435 length:249 start_codon:yes stop_codon:yes gene_type:complete